MKWLRFPVDDWAVALALALRAFPMLIDEFRLLFAARRLRPRPVMPEGQPRRRRWFADMVDLLAAGVAVALRRADEMGDAITVRGDTGKTGSLYARVLATGWCWPSLLQRARWRSCWRCADLAAARRHRAAAMLAAARPGPGSRRPGMRPRYISSKNGLMA